jgi:hypothetical protein
MAQPFILNIAALAIVPITAIKAKTAEEQVDAIWDMADDPATPRDRSIALLRLANKLHNRLNARKTG